MEKEIIVNVFLDAKDFDKPEDENRGHICYFEIPIIPRVGESFSYWKENLILEGSVIDVRYRIEHMGKDFSNSVEYFYVDVFLRSFKKMR